MNNLKSFEEAAELGLTKRQIVNGAIPVWFYIDALKRKFIKVEVSDGPNGLPIHDLSESTNFDAYSIPRTRYKLARHASIGANNCEYQAFLVTNEIDPSGNTQAVWLSQPISLAEVLSEGWFDVEKAVVNLPPVDAIDRLIPAFLDPAAHTPVAKAKEKRPVSEYLKFADELIEDGRTLPDALIAAQAGAAAPSGAPASIITSAKTGKNKTEKTLAFEKEIVRLMQWFWDNQTPRTKSTKGDLHMSVYNEMLRGKIKSHSGKLNVGMVRDAAKTWRMPVVLPSYVPPAQTGEKRHPFKGDK